MPSTPCTASSGSGCSTKPPLAALRSRLEDINMRVFLTSALLLSIAPLASAGPPKNFDDAPLRAVQFIDRNEGWAAGDDGAVWHTIDGGETWERQSTGVRGSLRALHFMNPYTGWIVGREELPGGTSAGIVLVTTDG